MFGRTQALVKRLPTTRLRPFPSLYRARDTQGQHYPLDGLVRVLDGGSSGMHQYFVKLVPAVFKVRARRRHCVRVHAGISAAARYEASYPYCPQFTEPCPALFPVAPAQELGEDELHSYQFSVTEHLRRIDPRTLNTENAGGLLPGALGVRDGGGVAHTTCGWKAPGSCPDSLLPTRFGLVSTRHTRVATRACRRVLQLRTVAHARAHRGAPQQPAALPDARVCHHRRRVHGALRAVAGGGGEHGRLRDVGACNQCSSCSPACSHDLLRMKPRFAAPPCARRSWASWTSCWRAAWRAWCGGAAAAAGAAAARAPAPS
jgi:hypothetical protein